MKDPRDVIKAPIITEKSMGMLDDNKYTFLVHPDSNKTEIRQAIESIFDVKVTKVATQNRAGKRKRRGYVVGRRPDTKRAIVTLAEGDEIELFDAGL